MPKNRLNVNGLAEAAADFLQSRLITYTPNIKRPDVFQTTTAAAALEDVHNGTHAAIVDPVTAIYRAEGKSERYTYRKEKLPALSFSGTFRESVTNANLDQHSGLFVADIDKTPPGYSMAELRDDLIKDPYAAFVFWSPSGAGLKVGHILDGELKDDADHKRAFAAIEAYYNEVYGAEIDPLCKDVRRFCFVSHDPTIHINPDAAAVFVPPAPPPKPKKPRLKVVHHTYDGDKAKAFGQQKLSWACSHIASAPPGEMHRTRFCMGRLIGGYVAGGMIDESEALGALEDAVRNSSTKTPDQAIKTVRDAFERYGKVDPVSWDEIKQRQRDFMESNNPKSESCVSHHPECNDKPFDIGSFALNGSAADMKKRMLEDKMVLGDIAILGQSTAIYAKPNHGKTLLTIWMLIEKIKTGEVNGADAYFVNADDNYKGLVYKLELAEKYGFKMLAPGHNGFKSDMLPEYLKKMIDCDSAKGKIIFLDTVKKFTDLMSKTKTSDFAEAVRQFVSHGGTVIMLAHVNKHRDEDHKVIYSGTSDLVDDADCAYTLDLVTDDTSTGIRTVKFENFKSRGDVAREAFYQYNYEAGTLYEDRLLSVKKVGEAERKEVEKRRKLDAMLAKNQMAVDVIKACIVEGITQKTALINEARERSGMSKKAIIRVLEDHKGNRPSELQFWNVESGDKHSLIFSLNHGVE